MQSDCSAPKSILRSSRTSSRVESKRVSIVSPMKWQDSRCSLERKRKFIDSTINFVEVQHILRSIGCDASGGYQECVEKLLKSEWSPSRRQLKLNERLRARPIHNAEDRIINLQRADMDYLSRFSLNDLKKWLKLNDIEQPAGANKVECMKLINKNYSFQSPSQADKFRPVMPKRPSCAFVEEEVEDGEEMEMDIDSDCDEDDDVRMQLIF